jgi:hypothetical protein
MHSYLVLSRWDFEVLQRAIADLRRRTSGADWSEVA